MSSCAVGFERERNRSPFGSITYGAARRHVVIQNGQHSVPHTQTVPLIREDLVLWSQGSAYPPPGSDTLSLPFNFVLPPDLPPTFHCSQGSTVGTVSYSLEVVGDRPGLFHRNRRLGLVFPLVPLAAREQVDARNALIAGWRGGWRELVAQDDIKHHLWSKHAHARATLDLPALASYPFGTPIPFRLRINTRTTPVKRDEAPTDELFPAPPKGPGGVELRLDVDAHLKINYHSRNIERHVLKSLGGLGEDASHAESAAVRVDTDAPEWIPAEDGGDKGVWSRTVTFSSMLAFACPPTIQTPTLSCNVSCMT
jgi:hypothetical protein